MTNNKATNRNGVELIERLLTPQELDYVAGATGQTDYIETIIREWPPVTYHQQISPTQD